MEDMEAFAIAIKPCAGTPTPKQDIVRADATQENKKPPQ